MRKSSILIAGALLAVSAVVQAEPVGDIKASTSAFTLDHRAEVPGQVLDPGDYSIHVVSILSNRLIVRIDSVNGKDHAIFLAVPAFDLMSASPGPIPWNGSPKGVQAMRGFYFPVGYAVEFVYPKAEAAELAQLNTTRVIAVDPDSEGRPKVKKMSPDDLQIVTLWSLSLTKTGPGDKTPALLAKRYQAPQQQQLAKVDPTPSAPVQQATITPSIAPHPQPAPTQVSSLDQSSAALPNPAPRRHPALSVLPHTASSLPLVFLFACLSLVAAITLRLRRLLSSFVRL